MTIEACLARWLIDKSVLARLGQPSVSAVVWEHIVAATVGISIAPRERAVEVLADPSTSG